jgi:outer membrane protein assembly factor BamA
VSFGYQWTADDVSAALSYRGENVKIYDPANNGTSPPELVEVLGSNVLHGFKLTLANDTRDSGFFPTSGHYAELGVEQVAMPRSLGFRVPTRRFTTGSMPAASRSAVSNSTP